MAAGRLLLREINRLAAERADFAFESTLSGLSYARQLGSWKGMGYRIEIAYLRLSSSQLALRRIAARVRQGGHDVPREDVLRRFDRGCRISCVSTARWRTSGRSTIIPVLHRSL